MSIDSAYNISEARKTTASKETPTKPSSCSPSLSKASDFTP